MHISLCMFASMFVLRWQSSGERSHIREGRCV